MRNEHSMIARLILVVGIGVCGAAWAHADSATYDVTHNFNFAPAGDVVSGQWQYLVQTKAGGGYATCGPLVASEMMPVTDAKICSSTSGSSSNALSLVATTNFAPSKVAGVIQVSGRGSGAGPWYSAAGSSVAVMGGKGMRNGRITWEPALSAQAQLNAGTRNVDTISFDVLDPNTGVHTSGTLAEIGFVLGGSPNYGAPPNSFSWAGNIFSVNASDFAFTIDMSSPYIPTSEQGTVDFVIHSYLVSTSVETGIFAGLFPPVYGALSNDLTLDYDLGNLGGANPTVTFNFDDSGFAAAPEPGTLALLSSGMALFGWLNRKRRVARPFASD